MATSGTTTFFEGLHERVDLQRFRVDPVKFKLEGRVLGTGMSGPVLSCRCHDEEGAAKLINVKAMKPETAELALDELVKLSALSVPYYFSLLRSQPRRGLNDLPLDLLPTSCSIGMSWISLVCA